MADIRIGVPDRPVTVVEWLKEEGDFVARLEPVLRYRSNGTEELLRSPGSGVLARIEVQAGEQAEAGATLGRVTIIVGGT
ncbi:MAG: lipoyl domain-containing protein [Chloroflexi bacterium]|nr:lipoyl domain-containing protein [Chloroflexota bacterium]